MFREHGLVRPGAVGTSEGAKVSPAAFRHLPSNPSLSGVGREHSLSEPAPLKEKFSPSLTYLSEVQPENMSRIERTPRVSRPDKSTLSSEEHP